MSAKENKKEVKKIVQVKNGEYLLDVAEKSVVTTYKRKSAIDVSEWSFDTLSYILSGLKSVGYDDVKILEIEKEKEVK